MALSIPFSIALAGLAALAATSMAAQAEPWRAIAAYAHGHTFSTAMSARTNSETEALANVRALCEEMKKDMPECTVVTTFNSGCRYVMLGGRKKGGNILEPVFLVGTTPDDARHRCEVLGLVCTREPTGGCASD